MPPPPPAPRGTFPRVAAGENLAQVLDADARVDGCGLETLASGQLLDVADAGLLRVPARPLRSVMWISMLAPHVECIERFFPRTLP